MVYLYNFRWDFLVRFFISQSLKKLYYQHIEKINEGFLQLPFLTKNLSNFSNKQYFASYQNSNIFMSTSQVQPKQPSPKALQKLQKYVDIRQRLLGYFFKKQPLHIKNTEAVAAYQDIYMLMNNMHQKFKDNNKFQSYDQTFLNQYQRDLRLFCQKARQRIKTSQNLSSEDYISYVLQWVYNYTRFMHWTFKSFMVIQKYSLFVKGTNLYYEGLQILRTQLIQKINQQLFHAIINCLDIFKDNNQQLKSNSQLIQIISVIGTVGLRKFTYIKLEKQGEKFVFVSKFKQTELKNHNQNPQNLYQTQFFKRHFTNRLIRLLKDRYTAISNDLIKLSTPQYVDKALGYLKTQQQTADIFYPNQKVKNLIIRSLQQVLSHQKAQTLIKKPNTGLFSMLQKQQIIMAKRLLQLIKRSSNFKLYSKQYQRFIQTKGNQIIDKVTIQDQRAAKKQSVTQMIQQLYGLYLMIEKVTHEVGNNDTELISAQTFGFQLVCNKGDNKVCNFLAYYADSILRKQQDSLNQMSDLTVKISKISKYLYSYDAFIKLYQKLLGLRMLYDCFKRKDAQLNIINVLKNQAGVSSLNKISCMVSDFMFSQNFNNQKGQLLMNDIGFKTQVMILTSGSWQIPDNKSGKNCVPLELMNAAQTFQKIYFEQLPDRTLTWVFNYGRAIVTARFDNQDKYILILTNYQLSILLYLQRNKFKSVKICELFQNLKIQQQPLFNASLIMLVKNKILLKEGNPTKIQSKNESIEFNLKFQSPSKKIKCFQLPRYVEKGTGQNQQLALQRSHLVDAAIVKVMKSKRIVLYQDLIIEVQKMCKTFKAEIGLIKKRIQNCQQRQFLERDPDDMNTLVYKP